MTKEPKGSASRGAPGKKTKKSAAGQAGPEPLDDEALKRVSGGKLKNPLAGGDTKKQA